MPTTPQIYHYKTKSKVSLCSEASEYQAALFQELSLYKLFFLFLSSTRNFLMNCTPLPDIQQKNQECSVPLFRSLRVPSSSLPGAVSLQVVLSFPFQYSKSLNELHPPTPRYTISKPRVKCPFVQKPKSTKQLSSWSCLSTSCFVSCLPVLEVP